MMSQESVVRRADLPLPRPYIEPHSSTEATLADIWAKALSMDRVGIEDRYLDLGGDSFLATVILEMIEETFGIEMPSVSLAGTVTVAALAARIDKYILKIATDAAKTR